MKRELTKYYFFFIAVFTGCLLAVQVKSSNTPYQGIITIPKILEMKYEIENVNKENLKIAESITEVKLKLKEYETSLHKSGGVLETMQHELENARINADYEDLEGPGIIISMNDSVEEVAEGDSLDWYVIHDGDILAIINELRAAGAEAISINDERVTATSNIRCGGPTINIDGKRHAVPFIIKAIGDPKRLQTAPSGYTALMEAFGIRIDIQKADKLTIKAYDGKYKLNYQKKVEDGE